MAPLAHLPLSQRFGWLRWIFRPGLLRALRYCHYCCSIMLLIVVLFFLNWKTLVYTAGRLNVLNISLHGNGQLQLCRVEKRLEARNQKSVWLYPRKPRAGDAPMWLHHLTSPSSLCFLIWDREYEQWWFKPLFRTWTLQVTYRCHIAQWYPCTFIHRLLQRQRQRSGLLHLRLSSSFISFAYVAW